MSKHHKFVTVYLPLILIVVTFMAVLLGKISEKAGVGITTALMLGQTWRFYDKHRQKNVVNPPAPHPEPSLNDQTLRVTDRSQR